MRTDFDVWSDNIRNDMVAGRLSERVALQKYFERLRWKEQELSAAQAKLAAARPSAEAVKIAGLVLIADKYAFPPVYGSRLAVPMLATTILRIAEATKS